MYAPAEPPRDPDGARPMPQDVVDQSDHESRACVSDCACHDAERRQFLVTAGSLLLAQGAMSAVGTVQPAAGPYDMSDTIDHFVPVDKKLSPAWVRSLFERGASTWYSGADLETLGMPVGGICAGQVYCTGDGRLVYWDIFNENINTGWGAANYWKTRRGPEDAIAGNRRRQANRLLQGFAIDVAQDGRRLARSLDAAGYPDVTFCGEYPIARIRYADEDIPVDVTLQAYSPFIPTNAQDSALPATVMSFEVTNTSSAPVDVSIAGWLENGVLSVSAGDLVGQAERVAAVHRDRGGAMAVGRARPLERQARARPPIVFADFEGGNYEGWTIEGEAFGEQPAAGTLENQQHVSGFKGSGLVNTFLGGDEPIGRARSRTFTIERPWIAFLIGGGGHDGQTCINLIVDGDVVRTATGRNNERLTAANWDVTDLAGRRAHFEIIDEASGPWGHINIDQIEFRDTPMPRSTLALREQPDFGSMAIMAVDGEGSIASVDVDPDVSIDRRIDAARTGTANGVQPVGDAQVMAAAKTVRLRPGETKTLTFVIAWYFPNLWYRDERVGNHYAKQFRSAADVASYVAANLERLRDETLRWHDTYYDSTLPRWLLDRIGMTVCNLATTTCQWWRNGRFWAWEGGGCCAGTCGHVWNYAHGLARLFPELERSAREMQDFAPGVGMDADTGAIAFRGEAWNMWAGDAQGGYVLKAYREHLCSADDQFLNRNWPAIRKAMLFLIEQDADNDGLIEGSQHQTYDQNYFGANTFVGALYLAALLAAAAMADRVGDEAFARRCRTIAAAGSRHTMDRFFNGEYFVQDVDLEKHPDWQYGPGCLADQLFGQSWAHQLALGYVYPKDAVRSGLTSVWKYCWAPDVAVQNKAHAPERWFAYPGEAGLFTCTWPKSVHLGPKSTRYRNEVWTGIEYQVASHMAWEGMLTECLAICRAIHDRYHPSKRNPFNEIECGDHYARSLASWCVLTGLSGFTYDGPGGVIGFAPRITPERFRAPFTSAEGWGTFEQVRDGGEQRSELTLRYGRLRLREVRLMLPDGSKPGEIAVSVRDEAVRTETAIDGRDLTIRLPVEVELAPGNTIRAVISM
jgi:non-lysosomal glucosylceramidase